MELHIAQPLVPELSSFVVEIAIAKLKWHKLQAVDQILAELIQAGGETLHSDVHKLLIPFGMRKKYLSSGRSLLL
jgi:hypothetical protein